MSLSFVSPKFKFFTSDFLRADHWLWNSFSITVHWMIKSVVFIHFNVFFILRKCLTISQILHKFVFTHKVSIYLRSKLSEIKLDWRADLWPKKLQPNISCHIFNLLNVYVLWVVTFLVLKFQACWCLRKEIYSPAHVFQLGVSWCSLSIVGRILLPNT